MNKFVPRLNNRGIYRDKKWYDDNPFYQADVGLPNCTCYAWGRSWEISGIRPTNFPLGDGGTWFADAVAAGLPTGQEIKLGAVVCYGRPGKEGHVAIVEQILPNGDFIISQSGYYRPIAPYPPDTPNYFDTYTCDKDSKLAPWMNDYYFQGCIYNKIGNNPIIGGSLPPWLLYYVIKQNSLRR